MRNYGTPLFFSKIALHGGGHLELKKMHKGDFWGLLGKSEKAVGHRLIVAPALKELTNMAAMLDFVLISTFY